MLHLVILCSVPFISHIIGRGFSLKHEVVWRTVPETILEVVGAETLIDGVLEGP